MTPIAASELILDKRGAIYHIGARPEEMANTIIIVGDPDRVKVVSKHFDRVEYTLQHREFITHTGYIGNKRISVLSTGIGPDNIDIAINELDALANIDFDNRCIKPVPASLNILRFGTSGSLQKEIAVDSFVAATHGLGFDNVMHFYTLQNTEEEKNIIEKFKQHTGLASGNVTPYIYSGSSKLAKAFSKGYHRGITVACPGFYGPQGRILRLSVAYPGLIDKLTTFSYKDYSIANFEMESSAIYGLGKALGHHCISLNAIVANRIAKTFSTDGAKAVENLITQSLAVIADTDF
ncbi:MAG: nucleoside phosphorylase [Bacteroidetes bacterium]|nr:nucleoside phosphorylase [Bacteroidota bacterium]MBS1757147.1 nucleoside phosphorylase [Bacteroidota bacterium]